MGRAQTVTSTRLEANERDVAPWLRRNEARNGNNSQMKIAVLGADGYLGWPTCLHLAARGHEVVAVDNFARRAIDVELGSDSLVPIATLQERVQTWREVSGEIIQVDVGDLMDPDFCDHLIAAHEPEAVVHFAEQRSA